MVTDEVLSMCFISSQNPKNTRLYFSIIIPLFLTYTFASAKISHCVAIFHPLLADFTHRKMDFTASHRLALCAVDALYLKPNH